MINLKTYKQSPVDIKPALYLAMDQFQEDKSIGYLRLPFADQAWEKSKNLGQSIRENYDHLVVVGIGGSSMGPRCIAESLNAQNISFLDNIDSIETETILKKINCSERLAWIFISKSGTTIEILWTLDLICQKYLEAQKSFWDNTFYITELTPNPLHLVAQEYDRPCLEIPLNVGGRFSVLTPVGLTIASYLGVQLSDIQQGAKEALVDKKNVVLMAEQFLASMDRDESITLFWLYSSRLRWFGFWLQQLWAESLGKKTNRSNEKAYPFSTPMLGIGASDQHSILQQVYDGPKNKFVCFFRFRNVENSLHIIHKPMFKQTQNMAGLNFGDLIKAEALATQKALDNNGISTAMIEINDLNPKSLGYLFMFFQLVVSTMAEYKNINAYDQPAVEHGKILIKDYLNTK